MLQQINALLCKGAAIFPEVFSPIFFTHSVVHTMEDPTIGTVGVRWNKKEKRILLFYSKAFMVECLENFKGDKFITADFFFIIWCHEMLHIILGHLTLDDKKIHEIYPKLGRGRLNMILDWVVNLYIDKKILPHVNHHETPFKIDAAAIEKFIKIGKRPPREWQEETSDGIASEYYWLKKFTDNLEEVEEESSTLGNNSGLCSADYHELEAGLPDEVPVKDTTESIISAGKSSSHPQKKKVPVQKESSKQGVKITLKGLQGTFSNTAKKNAPRMDHHKPHLLNTIEVLPNDVLLPVCRHRIEEKTMVLIDVSGSMSFDKMAWIWSKMEPYIKELSNPEFVGVDTEIRCRGKIRNKNFVDLLTGGGGTDFESAFHLLANKGYKNILAYTDGCFSSFEVPSKLNVFWFLVNSPNEFCMSGKYIYVEKEM